MAKSLNISSIFHFPVLWHNGTAVALPKVAYYKLYSGVPYQWIFKKLLDKISGAWPLVKKTL